MHIRIGTRKSLLSLRQTQLVIDKLLSIFPKYSIEIVPITTKGDQILNKALYEIGGKSLFIEAIEDQLIKKHIDIAVHSLKDMPGILDRKFSIVAVLERECPNDVLFTGNNNKYKNILDLPKNAIIGTSSPRRTAFIQSLRPDIKVVISRGNINTRIQKIENQKIDALILAYAGLKRTNLYDIKNTNIIETTQILPAAGQGIIAIETLSNNIKMKRICSHINDTKTWNLAMSERSFLEYLNADCRTAISAYARYNEKQNIITQYMLSDHKSKKMVFCTEETEVSNVKETSIKAAKKLLKSL
ncbi:hydroxymethylbilane synthase [Rickettsia endosymbiont of Cardiosporidium cionae]|uniref:hydroxymethylbilane synthase n=1 Tax=Rickettsia endosymbiont of Cardiosporidium cionae TaxID=2777155 RepID=UPI001E635710|nr:hydroxymethylbilane synthase [Rickettsia endosymbiont of Cardiosporidium cionae]